MAHQKLKKEISVWTLYAIALGATLSSGFFLLPGLAYEQAGPAVALCYLIAAIPLLPGLLSQTELATAMPKSGGAYFFLDRSLGPMIGTIGGLGTWLALVLKTSFALVGMGAYISIVMPGISTVALGISFAIFFGILNFFGTKKTALFQLILVSVLVSILLWFDSYGVTFLKTKHFNHFFGKGFDSIISTAGFVYVSYIGITKIASVGGEIKDPERNIPFVMILTYVSAIIIYGVSVTVLVGIVPPEELSGSLIPVALAAKIMGGNIGEIIIIIAAVFAFSSVANAGILSSSRYPLAMSRDQLMPPKFGVLSKYGTPKYSIILTVAIIILILLTTDPTKIAKFAGSFQLICFMFLCAGVIVMRESQITSYDPGFKSPFYPWMQILGILSGLWLIIEMGTLPMLFSAGLIVLGIIWYYSYGKSRVTRSGALLDLFARLGQKRTDCLDRELREIIKDKGLRRGDPYDEVVDGANMIEAKVETSFDEIIKKVSEIFSECIPETAEELQEEFTKSTYSGNTFVVDGVAFPHLHLADISHPELIIVRSFKGLELDVLHHKSGGDYTSHEKVFAAFFLVCPENLPRIHLRILAQIASCIEHESFKENWLNIENPEDLKEILLGHYSE